MDYGPFGFLDVYHPLSAKWTGSGKHHTHLTTLSSPCSRAAKLSLTSKLILFR